MILLPVLGAVLGAVPGAVLGVTHASRLGAGAAVSGTPCGGLIPRRRGEDLVDLGGAGNTPVWP